eukprot:g14889.t1
MGAKVSHSTATWSRVCILVKLTSTGLLCTGCSAWHASGSPRGPVDSCNQARVISVSSVVKNGKLQRTASSTPPCDLSFLHLNIERVPQMKVDIDIEELLALETELKTERERATSSVTLDAKLNILKYLQVQTVLEYEAAYDALHYELNKEGGMEFVHHIAPVRSENLVQPKVLELQHRAARCSAAAHMSAEFLFENLSPEVVEEMVHLARQNWHGTEGYWYCLADFQRAAGQYDLAAKGLEQILLEAEDRLRVFDDHGSKEQRRALLHANTARAKLSFILAKKGNYDDAGLLIERSLACSEKELGSEHPDVATELNNRAELFRMQGKFAEAEPLASLLESQGKYADVEPLYERCQEIEEKVLGPHHPSLATTLNNRAGLLYKQGKFEDADPLFVRVLEILGATVGEEHPDYASALHNLAESFRAQGEYAEAEPLNVRAIEIWEKTLGSEHPNVATALNSRAALLYKQGKYEEADPLYSRALEILRATVGEEHPNYASTLNNRAELLVSQGKHDEGDSWFQRALAIDERVLGPDHPDVGRDLNNRAGLIYKQGKLSEAEKLYKRAQEIFEKSLGQDHPDVAMLLKNRALLLTQQGECDEANSLYLRAIEIGEKNLGPGHPNLAKAQNPEEV